MSRKAQAPRTKFQIKGKTLDAPTTSVAAMCAVAMFSYANLVFALVIGETRETAIIPRWRVHMFSAWLGTVCFVITLFCLEALVRESKTAAFRSTVAWAPFLVLTGLATIFHIRVLVVIVTASAYGAWMYRRRRRIFPVVN